MAANKPFTDLAAAREGEGAIVAALAAVNDATAKRDDVAIIDVHGFDASGASTGVGTLTKRALASGGIAIATTEKEDDGAAVVWVARDGGDPQVHVSRTDKHGKLLRDVQLTSAKGDASDVAIAWAGEQWVVAWVDTRDGNGEVYAATLDRDGRNVGRGQRITNAPGDASDTALLVTGSGVWLAWADPRESPQDGFADIYAAQLRPRDASRVGEDARVLATAAHSRSPALGARGNDVAVGWIEEAPSGADPKSSRAYGAMFAWLAPNGHVASDPAETAGRRRRLSHGHRVRRRGGHASRGAGARRDRHDRARRHRPHARHGCHRLSARHARRPSVARRRAGRRRPVAVLERRVGRCGIATRASRDGTLDAVTARRRPALRAGRRAAFVALGAAGALALCACPRATQPPLDPRAPCAALDRNACLRARALVIAATTYADEQHDVILSGTRVVSPGAGLRPTAEGWKPTGEACARAAGRPAPSIDTSTIAYAFAGVAVDGTLVAADADLAPLLGAPPPSTQ